MSLTVREFPPGAGGTLAPLLLAMATYNDQDSVSDQIAAAAFTARVLAGIRSGEYHVHLAEDNGDIVGYLIWRLIHKPEPTFVEIRHPAVLKPYNFTVVASRLLSAMECCAIATDRAEQPRKFCLMLEGDDVVIRWAEGRGYDAEKLVRQAMAGLHKLTMTKRVPER